MSYSINGKIYTSHALMDEIVHNTKTLIRGLVLKNEKAADENETVQSIQEADYYIACKNGSMELSFFPLSKEILLEYGCTELQAQEWTDYTKIPEELQAEVLDFLVNYYIDNYVEKNDYYRKLNGQPEYSAEHPDDYNVTLGKYDYYTDDGVKHNKFDDLFAKDYSDTVFDFSAPLHSMHITEINTLEGIGVLDAIRKIEITDKLDTSTRTIIDPDGKTRVVNDSAKHYKYLDYLGAKQIDIYNARIASNWDILYMPGVEYLVEDRFKELYAINRDIYEKRTYQLAYKESSDYFEEMIILLIIGQTFADMITDTPEWYIRRDIFDLRSVQYFLTSQGVKFFEDIPMRYQIRIVKGLNKLIRYKSTDKNIFDILELFSVSGIVVYKYYLLKNRLYSDMRVFTVVGEEDPEWSMEAEYDFGFEDTDNIGNTGDGEGNDVPGSEVYDFVNMSDEDYVDPDAEYDYYYDFRSEDPDYWDESVAMLPEYDFMDEDEHPDEIINTSWNGIEDHVRDELFDFGFLDPSVIENYDERVIIYDFESAEADIVMETEDTERHLNYQNRTRTIKDEYGNVYELQFVKTPVGEEYDDYIKNNLYREDYDTLIREDKYWDGQDVHYYVRNQHLQKDFTIEGTKFMRLEYNVDMSESLYQKEYYLGMLLNARLDTDQVTVSIPELSNKKFTLLNLLLFVYCLNGIYTNTDIMVQDATQFVVKRTEDPIDFSAYTDWDGGFTYSELQEPEPEPPEEPFYGNDDFGFEDEDDIDNDTIEIIWDFGYNYYIDWETTPEYRNYDYGMITEDSEDDEYSESRVLPPPRDPDFDYYYDKYVQLRAEKPYQYNNMLYVDPNNGSLTVINNEFIDSHPELLGTGIFIVFPWTGLSADDLGYYTLDLNCHGVSDWNDRDQYELQLDGGEIRYSARYNNPHVFYEYIRSDHPELFVDCVGRIFGFNMRNTLEEIAEHIGFRHSEFGFDRAYTLEECGVANFISRQKFESIDDMYYVYQNNTKCYDTLYELIRTANTRDSKRVFEYVFLKLFTLPWDTAFYILQNGDMATSYDQILKEKDYTLYSIYQQLLNEGDSSLRIMNTRNILNDIADTLNYYIHGNNLQYVLSFIATSSYDALLHYVHEMIDFFKSWKMHFLDPVLTYMIQLKNEAGAGYGDQIIEYKINYWNQENFRTSDSVLVTPLYIIEEKPGDPKSNFNRMSEVVDTASHYVDIDPLTDKNYNGGGPADEEEYTDLNGGGVEDCIPYYQVNGGQVDARIDIYQLDGGGVLEAAEYKDIDGRHILDENNYLPISFIEPEHLPRYSATPEEIVQEVHPLISYDVDAGIPDIHRTKGKGIVVSIDRYNQIGADVVLTNYPSNGLEIIHDGLYFCKDPYISANIVNATRTENALYKSSTTNKINNLLYLCYLLSPSGLSAAIYTDVMNRFIDYNDIYSRLISMEYVNNYQAMVNQTVQSFIDWFNENEPYKWTELTEPGNEPEPPEPDPDEPDPDEPEPDPDEEEVEPEEDVG